MVMPAITTTGEISPVWGEEGPLGSTWNSALSMANTTGLRESKVTFTWYLSIFWGNSKCLSPSALAAEWLWMAEINTFAGQGKKSREKWTLDQLQAAYDSLDEIGDQVADTIKTAIED